MPGFIGARYQDGMTQGGGMILSPSLEVAYVLEFAPQRTQFGTLTDQPGSTFLVDGGWSSYIAAKVKVGGEIALVEGTREGLTSRRCPASEQVPLYPVCLHQLEEHHVGLLVTTAFGI